MQQLSRNQQQQRLEFYRAYAAIHALPSAFKAYVRQRVAFAEASRQLLFPGLLDKAGRKEALPAGYYAFLPGLRAVQGSALATNTESYRTFLEAFAATRLAPVATAAGPNDWLAVAAQQFGPGFSRTVVLAKCLEALLAERDAAKLAPLLPAFQRAATDSVVARAVRGHYLRRLEIAAGRWAPPLGVVDYQGQPVSLADFKGKVVYLAFWASWCGPCLDEVPASLALRTNFVGQDVVFLYLSVDSDDTNWREALADFAPPAANLVHARAPGFGSPAAQAYQIDRIPAYFIIGRDGHLVTSHAPRPSAGPAAIAALTQALGK